MKSHDKIEVHARSDAFWIMVAARTRSQVSSLRAAHMASMVTCMASKKVTVTIPEDLLEEIRTEADERGISAYVTEALRAKRDRDRLLELVEWLEEEHGPVTDAERSASYEALDELDAEHQRRRAGEAKHTDEAA